MLNFNFKTRRKSKPKDAPEPKWIDPLTELERWFNHLQYAEIEDECHCGSGKPQLYFHREEGTGCEDCQGFMMVYIPYFLMWNICVKFNIHGEVRERILDEVSILTQRPDSKNKPTTFL